ncbi:MAG: DUF4367 domain-containing protein [Dehalococcoidia bacterium]
MKQERDRELVQMETLLQRAADSFPFPATPDLRVAVRAELERRSHAADRWRGGWRRPALGLATGVAVVVVGLLAAIAIPRSRSAIAEFLHLNHVVIKQEQSGSPTPPVLAPSNFARPSNLEEASGIVDFPLRLPTNNGKALRPDAVYLQAEEFNATIVILAYGNAGYDIFETRDAYIEKLVRGPAPVEQITFSGHDAYWVKRGGHIVQSLDALGRLVIETRRTVERATLIWEQNGVTYRIESSLSEGETVAVAESLR